MKKISQASWNLRKPRNRTVVPTGSHCPVTGLWRPVGSSAEPGFVFEGSVMPTNAGERTQWQLVEILRNRLDVTH